MMSEKNGAQPTTLADVFAQLPNGLDEFLYIRLPNGMEIWHTPRLMCSREETAALCAAHTNTIRNWELAGVLENVSPDTHARYRFEDILAARRARGAK